MTEADERNELRDAIIAIANVPSGHDLTHNPAARAMYEIAIWLLKREAVL